MPLLSLVQESSAARVAGAGLDRQESAAPSRTRNSRLGSCNDAAGDDPDDDGHTQPPSSGPTRFSSTALVSWGTLTDPNKSFVNSNGETMYPYSQKVSAIVEVGNRVFVGGEFTDLVKDDRDRTPSGQPLAYLAELDTDGIPVPGSAFNATVKLDGAVRALHRSGDGRQLYVGDEFNRVNGGVPPPPRSARHRHRPHRPDVQPA